MQNFQTYSIIEQQVKPINAVTSCSECCMERIDGKLNIQGIIHRQFLIEKYGYLNCRKCPVHLNDVKTGEFNKILMLLDGEK